MAMGYEILMGMIFGMLLMAAWAYMMRYRSIRRITKAAYVKAFFGLNRDDLQTICGDNYPQWISFPVYEQVEWLNEQLSKLWPCISEATSATIKESVEPVLEEYRPPGVASMKFNKLSLGTVPPKIEGIRVQSLKKGQITMDIDFGWESDENIILGVELPRSSTSISVQMKDLRFSTVSRVIFQLSEQLPCISAVGVSLLSEPRIDFSMKPEGSLTAIPGISDMIDRIWKVVESFTAIPGVSDMINQSMRAVESFKAVPGISDMIDRTMNVVDGSLTAIPGISNVVNTIVTHMLQWPKRVVVLVGSVPVDTSELELKPEGKLTVKVVEANDLDMTNKSRARPYVVAYIRPLFKFKTEVIKNNLHPVWNESFELLAEDKHTQELTVEVFDQGIILAKRLGTAKFSLSELEPGKQTEATCTFKGKDNKNVGSCTVKLLYHQFSKEEQLVAFEEEKRELKEAGVKRSMKVAFNRAFPSVGYRVGRVRKVGIGLSNAGKFIGKTMTQGIPTKVEPQVLTE